MSLPPPKITIAWKDIHQEALGSAVVGVLKFLRRTKLLSLKPQKPSRHSTKPKTFRRFGKHSQKEHMFTLPETNSSPLKIDDFQGAMRYVSFREGINFWDSCCVCGKMREVDMKAPHASCVWEMEIPTRCIYIQSYSGRYRDQR